MEKIGIIGSGTWGTAIAVLLRNNGHEVTLWSAIPAEIEEMAKTIYDYWFVQFDFPNENGKSYKSSGGALLYNEVLKKEIPFGWTIDTLLLLCEYWNKMDSSQSTC